MILNLDALILAGGLGTRLQPVIDGQQKVLASAHGKPFLSYIFDKLALTGIKRTILCVGYKADQVIEAFGYDYRGMTLVYSCEESPLGTGGALINALDFIRSEFVLVLNGDSIVDIDLSIFLSWFFERGINAAICLTRVDDISRYGGVDVDKEGRILRFQEKAHNAEPGIINAGIYLFRRSILDNFPLGRLSLEMDVFPKLIGRMYGYIADGCFLDIGIPESYACVDEFLNKVR